jgi:DNA-binding NarL/FixJ family response regulator
MNILLIEDSAHRRVAILKHLMRWGHRVTPTSSIGEAEEIIQFVEFPDTPADVIVMAEHLEADGGTEFREHLGERFGDIRWILFPRHHDIGCLAERIEADDDVPNTALNVLLIEADDDRRAAMVGLMLDCRDEVTACRSVREATAALDAIVDPAAAPHAIVSDVGLSDGNGLSFYLAATRRFPDIRWIVTAQPLQAGRAGPAKLPLVM